MDANKALIAILTIAELDVADLEEKLSLILRIARWATATKRPAPPAAPTTANSGAPVTLAIVGANAPDVAPPEPAAKPRKARAPKPSPKSNTADVSDAQRKVLRHLEQHGAMTAAKLAEGIYGDSKRAGVLVGKVLRPLAKDGLAVESDGFWRVTEQGACVALDA